MSPTSQFEPTLTEYLRSLSKPETLDTLKKRFRNQPIEQQLSELLESGAAHAWPPYGNVKRGRYWFQGSDELIEKALLDTSARKLINKQDLLRGARKASFGPSEVTVKQVFEKLVAAGRLKVVKLPPNNAVRIWNPESPELVLEAHRKAFLTLTGKLEKIGVPQDALRKFLPSLVKAPTPDLAEQIYQAIAEVEPKHGVMAPIPSIRRLPQFEQVSKEEFDRAALQLLNEQRVFLNQYDRAAIIDEDERRDLIFDGHENHYVGITKR